jgi:hypothetical protein
VTAPSAVQPGDTYIVLNGLNGFSQIRGGARVGNSVTFANDQFGGVFADATGLYFAGNPGGTGVTVERIPIGQATSVQLLGSADLVGGGATPVLRDLTVSRSGNIFTLYTNGDVDRFTPAAGGTYTRTAVGALTGFTSADRGSGHQLSLTDDGSYVIASSRSQNRLWSLGTATGTVQTWSVPTGLLGPVTGTQLTASATSVLDPVRGNRVIVPMGNDGLYEVDFDPATGAFTTADPRRLTADTVAAFVDGVGFRPTGELDVSLRDTASLGSLRAFTQAELAAASGGSPFTIFGRAAYYSAADARIARDLAVVVPEPGTVAVCGLAAVGLLAAPRRRRRVG